MDREAIQRLEAISELPEQNKNFVLHIIDMALRDFKTMQAYK
jgi:hypothetical protein